jgi:hypothetical protein
MFGTHAVQRYIYFVLISVHSTLEVKKINALLRDGVCQCLHTRVSSWSLIELVSVKFDIVSLTLNVGLYVRI